MTLLSRFNRTTADWQRLDAAHHLEPFTDYKELHAEGVRVVTRAEGVWIEDSEGRRILDGMAGLWCVNVGYGRRELVEAATAQMSQLPYYNTFFKSTHMPAVELARVLADITPEGLNHAFFNSSGSEANDTVCRMVWHYWDCQGKPWRKTIISRTNGYHGSTVAGTNLGGMRMMHKQNRAWPEFQHIEQPYWYHLGHRMEPEAFAVKAAGWLEEKILEVGPDNVAAFVAEPIQGAGGVVVPPPGYWAEIQRICRKYGVLLVADEVICGFGRTGNWFGSDTFGIAPDLMPMAKGMTSGYIPLSAVMVHDRVAEVLIDKGGEFFHGFTYSGHPVACAVALENIRILNDEGIVHAVGTDTGPYFEKSLKALADHPLVGDVRAVGLVGAVELVEDKARHILFGDPESSHKMGRVGFMCRDHAVNDCGLMVRAVRDAMIFSPPLVITRAEIDDMMARFRKALDLTAADLGR